jgi:hypothetical protein
MSKVPPAPIKKPALRIFMRLRTVMATGFPLIAAYHRVKRTMACISPAVMLCPYHRGITLLQIFKKYIQIKIITVYVMQMYQVW